VTLREHLQKVEEATGERPPELDIGDPPKSLSPLWARFLELHGARTTDEPIGFQMILAYSELMRRPFTPDEVRAIRRLDGVFHKERNSWLT
jgi:hypothetical protein